MSAALPPAAAPSSSSSSSSPGRVYLALTTDGVPDLSLPPFVKRLAAGGVHGVRTCTAIREGRERRATRESNDARRRVTDDTHRMNKRRGF